MAEPAESGNVTADGSRSDVKALGQLFARPVGSRLQERQQAQESCSWIHSVGPGAAKRFQGGDVVDQPDADLDGQALRAEVNVGPGLGDAAPVVGSQEWAGHG